MRIGLIGLGRIGAFHARTLTALETVEELVVTDVASDVRERVAAEIGARAVRSVDDLLNAELDGVVIASSTSTHPELLIQAVEAGIPTFCEKPLAATATDVLQVRNRLAGTSVPVQVGFPRRFDPGFAAARGEVRAGRLGRLHTVRSTTFDPAPPPSAYI